MSMLEKIEIKNIGNIKSQVVPLGKITQIVGENGQGKTSFLDAIRLLFEGSTNPSIINIDAKESKVIGHLKDGTMMTHKLKRLEGGKGKQTILVQKEGMAATSPRTYINKMIGAGTFNPREMLDPKTRNEYIMEMIDATITPEQLAEALAGLDLALPELDYDQNALTLVDKATKHYFANRTERNRDTKAALTRYENANESLSTRPELQDERETSEIEVEVKSLRDKFQELKDKGKKYDRVSGEITKGKINTSTLQFNEKGAIKNIEETEINNQKYYEAEVKKFDDKIKLLQTEKESYLEHSRDTNNEMIKKAKHLAQECGEQLKEHESQIKLLEESLGEKPDIVAESQALTEKGDELNAELNRRKEIEHIKKQEESVESLKQAHDVAKVRSDALDAAISILRGSFKESIMDSVDLPINGLTYENGEFMVNGISMDRLASSEAVVIGLVLTQKANPHTNIICIDGAECLDEQTYAKLEQRMVDDNFKYIITKVGQPFKSKNSNVITMKEGQVQQ